MKRRDIKFFLEEITLEDRGPTLGAKGWGPKKLNTHIFSVGINYL